ncbi:MAG: RPA family protein [Thermoplasmatota archaeon]
MSMINREVAWRIFAGEYNQSTLETEGVEERSPSYVVTPLGAKINRLYLVGVLTETENIGTAEEPMWRARVTDPTGTFFVSAGQYQPNVATAMANLEPPTFVAVVGKANTYRPDEETVLVNVRGELIKEVSEEQRNYWILEAARGMKERLEGISEAKKMDVVYPEELVDLGYDSNLADGIKMALDHYEPIPLDRYWSMLEDAIMYVLPEYEGGDIDTEFTDKKEEETEKKEEVEDLVLEVLDELEALNDHENGVEYDQVMEEVMDREEVSQEDFEEAVTSLRNSGKIYEPVLGNLKRIY